MFSIERSAVVVMAASLAMWGATACGDDDPTGPGNGGPTAGTLTVTLVTPNADDGAILFTVNGPDMTQIAAGDAALYFRHAQDGATVTGVVAGDVAGGALLTFRVPDIDAAGSYSAVIQQVADRDNELRGSLAGYSLSVN